MEDIVQKGVVRDNVINLSLRRICIRRRKKIFKLRLP